MKKINFKAILWVIFWLITIKFIYTAYHMLITFTF